MPTQEAELVTPDARAIRNELRLLDARLQRVQRRVPGVWTIAFGVLFGMVLYSIIGFLITIAFWSVLAGAVAASANKTAQQSQTGSQR